MDERMWLLESTSTSNFWGAPRSVLSLAYQRTRDVAPQLTAQSTWSALPGLLWPLDTMLLQGISDYGFLREELFAPHGLLRTPKLRRFLWPLLLLLLFLLLRRGVGGSEIK